MPRTPVTYLLLAANILVFGLTFGVSPAIGNALFEHFALWPLSGPFEPWQLFSSAFLHGGLMHLATNMFGLWMFGRSIEAVLGSGRYVALYFASVLTAALMQLAVGLLSVDPNPTVGASGGLFGLLGAFAVLFPRRKILLLFPPIPMPAPVFVVGYAAFELYSGVRGSTDGVAHFAHLGGLIGGLALIWHWRRAAVRGA
ncbi:MAG: rhomboid family intramembrane serine protease [Solimonas sp.]